MSCDRQQRQSIRRIVQRFGRELAALETAFDLVPGDLPQTAPGDWIILICLKEGHTNIPDADLRQTVRQDLIHLRFVQSGEQARVQLPHLVGDPFSVGDQAPVLALQTLHDPRAGLRHRSLRRRIRVGPV